MDLDTTKDLHLLNTLTHKKEVLTPSVPGRVAMYTCGLTVYDYAHIGNLRSFVMADLLFRVLSFNGLEVFWVMNVTDIDDKTIRGTKARDGARATVSELRAYTEQFHQACLRDLQATGIDHEQISFIKITDIIAEIQQFVLELIEKKYAYRADDGSTYFDIAAYQNDFGDYAMLVGEKFLEGKQTGTRIKLDEYEKDNVSDFALWKAWDEDDADIYWEHPILGRGRPGWHIECSVANALAFNRQPTDVHTGGIDLLFPHHTNEIAQSQPFYKPFTRHWSHTQHLLVDGKKMAKRDKNFYTLKDVEAKGYTGLSLRYYYLQASYSAQQNFTWDGLAAADQSSKHLVDRLVDFLPDGITSDEGEASVLYLEQFRAAVNDDLNLPLALALAWELVKDTEISSAVKLATIEQFDRVFGLDLLLRARALKNAAMPAEILALGSERDAARAREDWAEADRLRLAIEAKGYLVRDTAVGAKITRK
ncbi:MAG: cysteine--tRNA ligase [Parcubacteria group bacterium RIFOXYD2_FULL_52_8]|nr:MAG: cysteine--tRNA ligase [Parcubacteria group bacterium RIFOXYD2_FULL_52_8]